MVLETVVVARKGCVVAYKSAQLVAVLKLEH